jgi:hypothetical protein
LTPDERAAFDDQIGDILAGFPSIKEPAAVAAALVQRMHEEVERVEAVSQMSDQSTATEGSSAQDH